MPPPGVDSDEITRLALAAKAGDRSAAAAFIRATQHDVQRFVSHLVGAGEAEDLAQETYLRAMRALPRFAARSSAKTWLLSIARRACVDHVRTAMRRPRVAALPDWQLAADAELARGSSTGFEGAVELDRLLADLPPDRREAFVATQVAGLSYAEAAEVCDCPIGTIRSRVARAREDLVAAMRTEGPGRRLRSTS
ncbi:sigma-70 family RNA polymerase sigma factor [Plantactinospora veratri]|uniref:RNA polymerase sigma factor n=1 Tax=Plantactinospora veratri TaxID=1436122 RepID=A0ABU7SDA2_9ACTN